MCQYCDEKAIRFSEDFIRYLTVKQEGPLPTPRVVQNNENKEENKEENKDLSEEGAEETEEEKLNDEIKKFLWKNVLIDFI